jgi:hypothetical protein
MNTTKKPGSVSFSARIMIIGINPFVIPSKKSRHFLFAQSGKEKGPIPIRGTVNGKRFSQTLVKYQGKWRLYLNTPMRMAAGIDVGDIANVRVAFDSKPRTVRMPKELTLALRKNARALSVFDNLPPSRRKEIKRYIASLKNVESVMKNVDRAIRFLSGEGRFVGRDKP